MEATETDLANLVSIVSLRTIAILSPCTENASIYTYPYHLHCLVRTVPHAPRAVRETASHRRRGHRAPPCSLEKTQDEQKSHLSIHKHRHIQHA